MSHKSRQTIISTPWEHAQWLVNKRERAEARARYALYGPKRTIKDQEAYDAVVEFNRVNGLGQHKPTETEKYLRKTRHTGRKAPITLAKHA